MTRAADDRELHARLRAALDLIGHDPGAQASLRELVIRAARALSEHAPSIQAQQYRAKHRALPPPADQSDPWRLNGRVKVYNLTTGTWSKPVLIVDRTVNAVGQADRIILHMRSIAYYPRGADYAESGASGVTIAVPEHADPAIILPLIDPNRAFRGPFKVFGRTMFIAHASRRVLVRARNKRELAMIYAQAAGYELNSSDLREFSDTGNEAELAAFHSPADHRQVLVNMGSAQSPVFQWYRTAASGIKV